MRLMVVFEQCEADAINDERPDGISRDFTLSQRCCYMVHCPYPLEAICIV